MGAGCACKKIRRDQTILNVKHSCRAVACQADTEDGFLELPIISNMLAEKTTEEESSRIGPKAYHEEEKQDTQGKKNINGKTKTG